MSSGFVFIVEFETDVVHTSFTDVVESCPDVRAGVADEAHTRRAADKRYDLAGQVADGVG
jgi:hypothetical protein